MPPIIRQQHRVRAEQITENAQATWDRFIVHDPNITAIRSIMAKGEAARAISNMQKDKPLTLHSRDEFIALVQDIISKQTKLPVSVLTSLQEALEAAKIALSTNQIITDLDHWQNLAFNKKEGVLKPALRGLAAILNLHDVDEDIVNIINTLYEYDPKKHGPFEQYATQQLLPTTRKLR